MKPLALTILALCVAGCGIGHTQWTFEIPGSVKVQSTADVLYVLKDPHWAKGTVRPWGVTLSDYASTTRVDGITATGNVVASLAKIIIGIP